MAVLESTVSRFNRKFLQRRDDRKSRDFDRMSPETNERKNREFVNRETGVAAWTLVPANSVAPALTGTATVGQTLTVTNGTWTNSPTLTRKWLRDGVAISGVTGTTYVLVSADQGKKISVEVTAAKTDYPDQKAVSNVSSTVA